jgi:uncharacterized glyoxalase superfamily protein PhnB
MINEETLEEYFLGKMKEVLLFDNDAQAIRFMEKYFEAKLQQERMYSEEELHNAFYNGWLYRGEERYKLQFPHAKKEWFEHVKKKYDDK